MTLKPRTKPSGYESADIDFELLQTKQEEYTNYFLKDSTLWPVEKYHSERSRINQEWFNQTPAYATWTKEIELQDLDIAFNAIKTKEVVDRVIISTLFARLYSYFPNMVTDFDIGYLEDQKFAGYLTKYNDAIQKNKGLKLNCWRKNQAEQIEKTIAKNQSEQLKKLIKEIDNKTKASNT